MDAHTNTHIHRPAPCSPHMGSGAHNVSAVPESSEELRSLLRGRSPEEQLLVIERIQKCHHPSLAAGNKAKLQVGWREYMVGLLSSPSCTRPIPPTPTPSPGVESSLLDACWFLLGSYPLVPAEILLLSAGVLRGSGHTRPSRPQGH